jgi:hypothetical protein
MTMNMLARCFSRKTSVAAFVAAALFLHALGAAGQDRFLYQWTDEKGTVHITDSPDKVPKQYRSQTQSLRQSGEAAEAGQEQRVQQAAPGAAASEHDAAESEADQKEAWQRRMRNAKARLDDAQNRVLSIEQQKQAIALQWGSAGAALPPQQVLDQLKQLDSDLAGTQREIADLRNEINVVIPDEARKAGIPPGWLREVE